MAAISHAKGQETATANQNNIHPHIHRSEARSIKMLRDPTDLCGIFIFHRVCKPQYAMLPCSQGGKFHPWINVLRFSPSPQTMAPSQAWRNCWKILGVVSWFHLIFDCWLSLLRCCCVPSFALSICYLRACTETCRVEPIWNLQRWKVEQHGTKPETKYSWAAATTNAYIYIQYMCVCVIWQYIIYIYIHIQYICLPGRRKWFALHHGQHLQSSKAKSTN